MEELFPEIKKKLGFGCMRFPMQGQQVDEEIVKQMVDAFLAAGFNYFDTARPYHSTASEQVLRRCLTSRYPRESYVLANKLSPTFYEKEEEILPLFYDQLRVCGVEYFDFYLFHANSAVRHEKFTQTHAYDIVKQLKAEGKIRHIATSFHDRAEVLEQILTEHPEIEAVQLQFNYADYEDPKVQSRRCYEVCQRLGKPVLVMEPVKGGSLAALPPEADALLAGKSPAEYAIRYAAGFEGVFMVLSGMSDLHQMQENLSFMADFQPLSSQEQQVVGKLRTLYQSRNKIPCTACRYCTDGCPAGIDIPTVFRSANDLHSDQGGSPQQIAPEAAKCIGCGQCAAVCPQHLNIPELMTHLAENP